MSSLGDSSESVRPADLFVDLWKQLGECHQNAVQDLEAKVSKLKKDRCLDAQKLEVFYNRNQQLKEQNQTLQDTICVLEERLRAGECNTCAVFEDNLKTNQEQNLHIINKLQNERTRLEDKNRKLQAEVQKLKSSHPASSPEQEEGVIPDSPVLSSSLPVSNKLKKRKHAAKVKHVRYAEMSLPQGTASLFYESKKEPAGGASNPGKTEVLVPNTCELDASQMSNDVDEGLEGVIAETCGFQLGNQSIKKEMVPNQQSDSSTWKFFLKPYNCSSSSSLIHSPDSATERCPSVLPHAKRFLEEGPVCSTKRKKEESDSQVLKCSKAGIQEVDKPKEGKHVQPKLIVQTSTSVCSPSFKKPPDNKAQLANGETSSPNSKASCISPDFKKPQSKTKEETDVKKRTLQDLNASHKRPESKDGDGKHTVESAWSIDPALALSMYESEQRGDEDMMEQQRHEDLADTDCTWVSRSMLQRPGENRQDGGDMKSGLGQKANDSLDMMFDTTAHEEYKSQLDLSQPFEEDDEEMAEEEEEKDHHEQEPPENISCRRKPQQPTFKHMAVIRKKDERRKLKGTTCKECEVYYAHLPEEEKHKKLSACSRHRFLYIPPCTPENFWEVGFPSTQTCIERGYIKEEKNPQTRSRRRQPFNALFSPKQNQQQTLRHSSLH